MNAIIPRSVLDAGGEAAPLQRLNQIIRESCVLTDKMHWLVSPTGVDNTWLIDLRQAFLNAEALDIIAELFWDRYAQLLPFQLGGLEIAGIPLVVGLLMKARQRGIEVNGFILRKERKSYGVGKILEGRIGPEPIFVVDDLINSANTLEKVRASIAEMGRKVEHVFVVVDYGTSQGAAWLTRHNLTLNTLFNLADFGLTKGNRKAPKLRSFETVWNFASPNPNHFHVVPKSSPVIADGKIVFGSDAGTLWALDAASGRITWQFLISGAGRKGIWSRPAATIDRVCFGAYDGNLYCLGLSDGKEVWRHIGADWIGSSPVISEEHDLVWIGFEHERPERRGSLAAIRLSTGERIWEHWVPDYVHGTPAFSARFGAIAIGANDKHLYLFDALTGALRWRFPTQGAIKEAPTIDDARGLVYFGSFDGAIRAVDMETGQLCWTIMTKGIVYSTPLLAGDKLFVSSTDKHLHIVDLAKSQHRRKFLESKSFSSPTLIQDRVFVGANNGVVYEIDPRSDAVTGRLQLPDPVTNRILYSAEHELYYALTYMNQLFAFRPDAAGASA